MIRASIGPKAIAHNSDFGGERFPDAIKWLWRKEKHEPILDTKGGPQGRFDNPQVARARRELAGSC